MGISAGIGSTIDIGVCGVGGTEVWVEGTAAGVGAAVAMGSSVRSKSKKPREGNLGGGEGCECWVGGLEVDILLRTAYKVRVHTV